MCVVQGGLCSICTAAVCCRDATLEEQVLIERSARLQQAHSNHQLGERGQGSQGNGRWGNGERVGEGKEGGVVKQKNGGRRGEGEGTVKYSALWECTRVLSINPHQRSLAHLTRVMSQHTSTRNITHQHPSTNLLTYLAHTHTHTHIYIYIYIYICVCVCVCVFSSSRY